MTKRPVLLCVLDGWGYREETQHNAIAQANTPNWDKFWDNCPHALLKTSGLDVGLPDGQMGNSEVGHMNLGAGRIVFQDLPRINKAITDGSLATNPALQDLITNLKKSDGACHLMGLLSPGGVHAHMDHLVALCKILNDQNIKTWLHIFLDGRDTPPQSAKEYVKTFTQNIATFSHVKIATMAGRYYAMDRDQRWDRIEKSYQTMMYATGTKQTNPLDIIQQSYDQNITDEFMVPVVMDGYDGMKDGDGLLMGNFRSDRVRQILTTFVDPVFKEFETKKINWATCVGMTSYSSSLDPFFQNLFPPEELHQTLGEILSTQNKKQLRIAETEKYAHVTFFFNGGRETVFDGEDRILVPSPKVATYDLQPEMAAPEVTDKLVEAIASEKYDAIILNYANTDMVGHSGDINAAIKAVEAVDQCLGRLAKALEKVGGCMAITADHGNAELMHDEQNNDHHTAHTLCDVPLVLVHAPHSVKGLRDGKLADVAPTLLDLLQLDIPAVMTGQSLLVT